ncbi:MAG: hypothetical protein GX603_01490 [Chloroflexi bacterium]|nr:hypothetical protein [Chloroflexota bacterium]
MRIIADTTCCLPVHQMKKLGIDFLPQIITFEGNSYRED